MTTFNELVNMVKTRKSVEEMGQELNRDIVKEIKKLKPTQSEVRKELNKQRIKALGLSLIQGGKV